MSNDPDKSDVKAHSAPKRTILQQVEELQHIEGSQYTMENVNKIQIGVGPGTDTDREAHEEGDNEGTNTEMVEKGHEKEIEDIQAQPILEVGPYHCRKLISNIPSSIDINCCEAYDSHIYLGTKQGDLLHYFEIEKGKYMLVSNIKFNNELTSPIDKLLLLPKIERALILSGGNVELFLLPEFAPQPNTMKLRNVHDMSTCKFSVSSKSYKIYISDFESVCLVKVTESNISISRKYELKFIEKLLAHKYHLLGVEKNSYKIFNMKDIHNPIPLFSVAESMDKLAPVFCSFNECEFILCTGGSTYDDNSMALVVSHIGDISRSTVVLERYPRQIAVQYPYILLNLNFNLSIMELTPNSEPKEVQKSLESNEKLSFTRTCASFEFQETEETTEQIIDHLRFVPLNLIANTAFGIEKQKALIKDVLKFSTNILVYGKQGIYCIGSQPAILHYKDYDETQILVIQSYIKEIRWTNRKSMEFYEYRYFSIFYLLLVMLHCDVIGKSVFEDWASYTDAVDMRILFFVLNMKVIGDIWAPNGLIKLIEELRGLKLINKCPNNLYDILKSFKNSLKSKMQGKFSVELSNTLKTIDFGIMNCVLNDPSKFDLSVFDEASIDVMLSELTGTTDANKEIIISMNKFRGYHDKNLALLREANNIPRFYDYLTEIGEEISSEYRNMKLESDLAWLINGWIDIDKSIAKKILTTMATLGCDPQNFFFKANIENSRKVIFVELLGLQNSENEHFLIQYYCTNLGKEIEQNYIWDAVKKLISNYKMDLSHTKVQVRNYLKFNLEEETRYESFNSLLRLIEKLHSFTTRNDIKKKVFEYCSKMDNDNILIVLLFDDRTILENRFMTEEQLYHFYLGVNDFCSINHYTTEANLEESVKHIVALEDIERCSILTSQLLSYHIKPTTDKRLLCAIIDMIPKQYPAKVLSEVFIRLLIGIQNKNRTLILSKEVVISEVKTLKHIIDNISG